MSLPTRASTAGCDSFEGARALVGQVVGAPAVLCVSGDHARMNQVIAQDILKPISDETAQKADVLRIGQA